MDLNEPPIHFENILVLEDTRFNSGNDRIDKVAGPGIGRAAATAADANNLTVLGVDSNEQEGEKSRKMARDLGGHAAFVKADLTKDSDIENAVSEAAKLGTVKYLINIAGTQHIHAIENFAMEKYDLMERLMLRAPFYLSKLAIPLMRNSSEGFGVIGNMASIHSHITTCNKTVHNITKFGLRGLSQSISAEEEGKIRSFTVSTGYVKTPLVLIQIPAQPQQLGISEEESGGKLDANHPFTV